MTTVRADLHNHSYYSPDSIASPAQMLRKALKRRINVLAVTDHNTIRGGLVARNLAAKSFPDLRVIVGEEVRTRDGEVLGLFLSADVPRDLSAEETIALILAQGGVAGAPHPFDTFRSGLDPDVLARVAPTLDFIEGFNARMTFASHNDRAIELAAELGLPTSAASDAHSPREIGRAWVEMPDFTTPAEFVASLKAGKLRGKVSSPLIHLISRYATIRRKLGWKPPA
ncbi:MAG TPA: PHP domain-containing protein [Dehalococcoidia bacterium]|nr:PHP domain-containing protein [Dehalococcoidia bacterium]